MRNEPVSGHLTLALHAGQVCSSALSTLQRSTTPEYESNSWHDVRTDPNAGFSGIGSVIGVVCDLDTNSIRWYINDQPLRSTQIRTSFTDDRFGTKAVDFEQNPGTEFVWTPTKQDKHVVLTECVPFVAAFGGAVRLVMVNDWLPPNDAYANAGNNKQ